MSLNAIIIIKTTGIVFNYFMGYVLLINTILLKLHLYAQKIINMQLFEKMSKINEKKKKQ